MKTTTSFFLFSTILIIGLACTFPQATQQTEWPDQHDQPSESPKETTAELSGPVDQELFRQIRGLGNVFAQNNIWRGYEYTSYGQYLVHVTDQGPDRAFLINPNPIPKGAILLGENESQGLPNVYRYDLQMRDAYNDLFGPNGNEVFTFNYQIGGREYYLQAYSDDLAQESNDPSMTVSYSTHELFHRFQDNWEWVPNSKQDFDNFPLSIELLELQILCQEVLKGLPDPSLNNEQMINLLQQYVAIRSRELVLDPTSDRLIRNHELYQEQMEGSACFIEVMSNHSFFPPHQYDRKFGYSLLEFWVESKEDVRGLVGQSVYYGTGGGAIYLLYRLGVPIEQMQQGKTPYELAAAYLNMSAVRMDLALKRAYSINNIQDIKAKASEWMALK